MMHCLIKGITLSENRIYNMTIFAIESLMLVQDIKREILHIHREIAAYFNFIVIVILAYSVW